MQPVFRDGVILHQDMFSAIRERADRGAMELEWDAKHEHEAQAAARL